MYHLFHFHRDEFLSHYHRRSNVESTFSMIKAEFRDHVRSKSDVAMVNECLAKFVCHNICCVISAMHELGITPDFAGDAATAVLTPLLSMTSGRCKPRSIRHALNGKRCPSKSGLGAEVGTCTARPDRTGRSRRVARSPPGAAKMTA
jgi:hypothetical protein